MHATMPPRAEGLAQDETAKAAPWGREQVRPRLRATPPQPGPARGACPCSIHQERTFGHAEMLQVQSAAGSLSADLHAGCGIVVSSTGRRTADSKIPTSDLRGFVKAVVRRAELVRVWCPEIRIFRLPLSQPVARWSHHFHLLSTNSAFLGCEYSFSTN